MATFRTQQLTPTMRRVWHDPSGTFERDTDSALGDWARSTIAATAFAEAPDLAAAATLHGGGGAAVCEPLEMTRDVQTGEVRIAFALEPGERLYGAYDADARSLDRRGDHVHLVTEIHPHGRHLLLEDGCSLCGIEPGAEPPAPLAVGGGVQDSNYGELVIPFVISSRGYAVYVANLSSPGLLDLGAGDDGRWSFTAPAGDADMYLFGPAPLPELLKAYTRLTGNQPLPPTWALGLLQSRFGYESFDHALEVLDRFEREQLPVHGMVFDVQWLEEHVNLRWDPVTFPDPVANLGRIADHGVRVVVITEPGTRTDASNFAPGVERDAFAQRAGGGAFDSGQWYCRRGSAGYREIEPGTGAIVNFFKEDVADWWYGQHLPLLEQGVDAWWLDLNEPEDVDHSITFPNTTWPFERELLTAQEGRNTFAIAQQRAFARRDRLHSDRRPFVLTRSGSAGSQRYGAAPWSGDIAATWHDMRRQTHLALTAGLSGIPLWGCDVGGFNGDPGSELFVRWMQLGSVLPIFRPHGHMVDREPWSQGPEALEALRPSLMLRAQLLPSLATWAFEALRDGLPLAQPMLLADPDDARFHDLHDQWLLGPVLAAPVLEEGARSRMVHLPRSGTWVDIWSGSEHEGGDSIEVTAGLGELPLFIPQAQALIADGDPLARRGRAWPPAELEVWSWGARAEATLYVDDGATRMHEEGAYCHQQVTVADGVLSVERIGGGWPQPRLRTAAPHPGRLAAGAGRV